MLPLLLESSLSWPEAAVILGFLALIATLVAFAERR